MRRLAQRRVAVGATAMLACAGCQALACADARPVRAPTVTGQSPPATRPPRAVGCLARPPRFREHGAARRRAVALTFDGGPTGYTPRVLAALHRYRAHATFFLVGRFIPAHAWLVRRELKEGDELANHSYTHPHLPSFGQLSHTSALIRRVSGFTPCLFRAPYGEVNARLIADAWRLRMSTIQWSVDTLDSLGAGPRTVYRRATALARPGSIILMHDGDGDYAGSLGMLPGILSALRRRHLQVVTVSRLLGFRTRWARPPRRAPTR
jgi:peptidoglycan/xylan/chitin deacetylase (PgdA/CDA1 family)